MELLQTKATSIYIQPDEPMDAPEGSLWIQVSENESEGEEDSDEIIITVNGIPPDVNGNIEVPIPEKLPNPQKLIFTGNVNKNYDGSTEVSIDIPKEITVNGKNADENGNIEIDIPIEITVNGKNPDENGNIEINFSVNGNEADENGNINLNIPDAQQQSDWNQNNSSNITFIKNRTHWEETINGVSTVHPLDDKFIPNSIARVSDIPDAILNPGVAAVGQTIVVKAIDENGKPIEWEVIDFPEVDLTGYYTKEEIDVLLDNYITTVDTLIGEEE